MEFNLTKVLFFQWKRATKFIVKTLIFFCCATVFSYNSDPLFSQNTKVSIVSDQTLTIYEVLELIGKQAECTFIYQADIFDDVPKIHLKKGIIRVSVLLEESLPVKDFEISETKENYFTISRRESKVIKQDNIRIKGKTTDNKGMPIAGVHVMSVYTKKGVVTDFDGAYQIEVNPSDSLLITAIGYKSQTKAVNNQKLINIKLIEDITELGTVMINAGYYSVKEKERTGNISKVNSEDIELQPIVSPMDALNGRVAGLEIIPGVSQGNPGAASTIRIRGQNSLREEGNYPLYIIDGVPINSTPVGSFSVVPNMDPLNYLNPSNIESIEILKDADATAIYGSRGANGVILITTKKGLDQKTKLETRVYTGLSEVPNRLDLLNTQQYLSVRKKAFENDGVNPTSANAYDLLIWDPNKNTDWQDLIFGGTSEMTDVNLSLSGGNGNTFFRLGGSYRKQGTVYLGDYDYNKLTAGLNINHTSENTKFKANLSVNYGADLNNLLGYVNLSSQAFTLPPNAPSLFNSNGSLNFEDWGNEVDLLNPLQGFFNSSKTHAKSLVTNINLTYQILKGLDLKANLGYTTYNGDEIIKRPQKSYADADRGNSSVHRQTNRDSWIIEPQIHYKVNSRESTFNLLMGLTLQDSDNKILALSGNGYVSEGLIGNLSAAEQVTISSNQMINYRYAAVFGRLGYSLKNKYFINLTGRRDGSSRFGPGKRFANFGAIGAAWIFSEEPFIKDRLSFLSFGKLRGSYGTTGNDQIPDYGYLDAYEPTQGSNGLYPVQLFNPGFSWEINKKMEAAIELGVFKNHINLGLSWYRNRSSNQLVGYALPNLTGFTEVQANLPATVQNTGWELELTTENIRSEKLKWNTSFNISFPKNKLVNYPDIEQSSYVNKYRVGYPLNIRLLYDYTGLNPDTGYYDVKDINEDGRYNFEDRQIISELGRKFFGGINNALDYKGFTLQFLWEFAKQEGSLSGFNAGALGNQRNVVLQALEEDTSFQKVSQTSQAAIAYSNIENSTFSTVDASFVRLKTCVIGYKLPNEVLASLGISQANLFLTGQNLLTVTGYKGMDPETPFGGTTFSGLRTLSCGIQLNF